MTLSDDNPQTKYFQACRLAFEGGGCRGAAHVGAYAKAVQCGVNPSEVAGTSAGSIIAALVGAGATPAFLLERCAAQQFSELLTKPQMRIAPLLGWKSINRLISWPFSRFLDEKQNLLRRIVLLDGAAYSSTRLEEWIDDLLAELLPEAARPVRFKDLILPTSIVAGDLSGKRYKLWSSRKDPDAKVAMAVRCSCSIPLFFEPVQSGNDFLVDGGILSNLPTFVFSDENSNAPSLGGRILAFRLVGIEDPKTKWTLPWILQRLIDTMISGATDLQAELQTGISTVKINTGHVSGTDFKISQSDVRFLIDEGQRAMATFVRNEHKYLADATGHELVRYGEDELFDDLVQEMASPGKRLLVNCDDTEWFWRLFPSVAHWLFNGARVDILTNPVFGESKKQQRENQRRAYLRQMGATIVERQNNSHPNCFIISRADDHHDAAVIREESQGAHAPVGIVYVGAKHRSIIRMLKNAISSHFPPAASRPQLELVECGPDKLIEQLREGVHQYSSESVRIEQQRVSLLDGDSPRLELIVRRIRTFKYRQIQFLDALYEKHGIPFCAPAEIRADGNVVSTVTPPVLEEWNDRLVVVEGNTRLFYLIRSKATFINCLVVKGVTAPLPGRPVEPRRALLTTSDFNPAARIEGFDYSKFRSIESAARPLTD